MGGGSKDSLGTGVGAAMPPSSQQVRHMKLRWQTGAASLGSGVLLIALSNSVLAAGLFQPAAKELRTTYYQWAKPFVMDSTLTERTFGLAPTPLEVSLAAADVEAVNDSLTPRR